MHLSICCAAAAALIGSSLLGGCASKEKFPASPVPVVLSDVEAAKLADMHLAQEQGFEARQPASMEPTGDGYLVEYRTAFDSAGTPPRESRLVSVKHDGTVRELQFREGR